jgi:hypothetical protein
MWEPYLRAKLPAATEDDFSRLEALAGGPLPQGYWELAIAHQGEALDEGLVQDPAFEAFVLLLVLPPERLAKTEVSYSIGFTPPACFPSQMTRAATCGPSIIAPIRTRQPSCSSIMN